MTAERLIDCIGLIDEKFISEAEGYVPARRIKHIAAYLSAAACICIAVTAMVVISGRSGDIETIPESSLTSITEVQEPVQTTYSAPAETTWQCEPPETEKTVPTDTESDVVFTEKIETETAPDETDWTTVGPTETTPQDASETSAVPTETSLSETEPPVTAPSESFTYGIDETLAGIYFDSSEQMKGYLESLTEEGETPELETEIMDYLSSVKGLYVIEDMSPEEYEHQSLSAADITQIFITPTYAETDFEIYGNKMQLYYYYDPIAGKRQLDQAKYYLENDSYSAVELPSYGEDEHKVYCYTQPYFDDNEYYYVWEQNGEYFMLRTREICIANNNGLCNAKFCAFE